MLKTASIISFTQKGQKVANRLEQLLNQSGYKVEVSCGRGENKVSLSQWTKEKFEHSDVLIFVAATGIAVRAVAPYIKSKILDPAVIVMDDNGNFCIPLLSGHVGGANNIASLIAEKLGAIAVITTATDVNGVFAIDTFAKENNMAIITPNRIKDISAKLLDGKKISIYSDFPVLGDLPDGVEISKDRNADVIISYKDYGCSKALVLAPKVLAVGIGCRKNTQEQAIAKAVNTVLKKEKFLLQSILGVYSIDLKANEQGLIDYCSSMKLDFTTFTAEQLLKVEGELSSSNFVKSITGVDNVCERSAVLGSGGVLLSKKFAQDGVTVGVAKKEYQIRL